MMFLDLFQFKRPMRAMMPDEIQLSSSISNKKVSLIYQYNNLEVENQLTLFKKYLSCLVYDISSSFTTQLSRPDVYQLKESITLLYKAYKKRKLQLEEVEGVWALLTFRFSQISGLQLYLAFQNLAKQIVFTTSQVKQQQQVFDPKGFFHNNNNWIKDKKFIDALRVLQKSCLKTSYEKNKDECLKILKTIINQNVQLMIKSKEFIQEFKKFKAKVTKICQDKEMVKKAMIQSNFVDQQKLMEGFVMSDPGDFMHILNIFKKQDFIRIQSCQHDGIKVEQDESRVRSLYNQPIKQIDSQKKAYQSTENMSSPTKRRIPEDNLSNQFIEEPRTRRHLYRRPPRFKFIARLYKLEKQNEKKLNKFKQIKMEKEKIQKIKNNSFKVLKVLKKTQKRLKKLKKNYYSDQQKNRQRSRPKTNQIRSKNEQEQFCIQESVSWSSDQIQEQRSERMSVESSSSSQSITMKRRRPTKNQVNTHFRQFMEDQSEDYNYRAGRMFQNVQQSCHISRQNIINQEINFFNYSKSQETKRKQCANLKFLKLWKPHNQQKYSQSLQNISIRHLQLNQHEQLEYDIFFSQYLWYLQSLQEKQVKREIIAVSQQLLAKQYHQNNVNTVVKILAFFIISQDKTNTQQCALWQKFKQAYIDPMLKHCISTSLFSGFSEILNNLTVACFNQDLVNLGKIKKHFYYLFQIVHSYDYKCKGIQQKFLQIVYELFPTPQKIQNLLKYQANSSKINLQSAFKLGIKFLKFQLCPKDQIIAIIISAFIFEQLVLHQFIIQITNYEDKRKKYFDSFIKDMQQRKLESKEWLMKFSCLIKQFYKVYNPNLNKGQFISLANLINVSLSNLMGKVLEIEEQTRQIKEHADFLQFICTKFLSQADLNNKSLLLNIILVQTKISSNYKQIIPQKIQTMVIYPGVLSSLWNHKEFRSDNRLLVNTTKLYLAQVKKALDSSYFQVKNSLVSESLSKMIKTIYQVRLLSKLGDQNNKFTLTDLERQENTQHISLNMLRKIICTYYGQLDRFLEEDIKYEIKRAKQQKAKHNTKMQEMTIKFLNDLIPSKRQYENSKGQQSILNNSISHYFFVLKFILQQNFFQKYYKSKIENKIDFLTQFLIKCNQILSFYFSHPPNFMDRIYLQTQFTKLQPNRFEDEETENPKENAKLMKHTINTQLNKQYYQLINDHFKSRNKLQHLQQFQIITQINRPYFFPTLANIYSTHMVSYFEIFNKQSFVNNPIIKYIQNSSNNINAKKIEKSVYFLKSIFKQIQQYLQLKERFSKQALYSGAKTVQSEALSKKIKKQINSSFLLLSVKPIVAVIVYGFVLKNSQEYAQMPLEKLIQSFAKIELIDKEQLKQTANDCGYIHFLYAMQCIKENCNLSDILNKLFLIGNKTAELSQGLNRMLTDLFNPLRQLLLNEQDKSIVTLQALKVLTFALTWPEMHAQCIKKYLNDMQVISKGQSLIQRIPITQKNVEIILQLFQAIDKSSQAYFKIKQTQSIYVKLVCSSQRKKENQGNFYKRIEKLLLCLHQICNSQQRLVKQGKVLIKDVLAKLFEPVLKSSQQFVNAAKRLDVFCEMLKISQIQRPIYQSFVIENKRIFQSFISILRPTSEKISTFEQFVQKFMIGQYSDFFDLKRLIGSIMRENVLSNSKKQFLNQLIQKMKRFANRSQVNLQVAAWCEKQMARLNQQDRVTMIEQLSDWMDLQ